jgi:hypothetical protein
MNGKRQYLTVSSLLHDGTRFNPHVHVIAASSLEVQQFRRLSDRLRADPALTAAHVAAKRTVAD